MKTFNPSSDQANRAVQAWMILIGMAMNRQTETYKRLSVRMFGREAAGVLGNILGHIAFFCEDNDLPQLNVLVVGTERGTPGHLIPLDSAEIDAVREAVYQMDWYNIVPPTAAELSEAYNRKR